MSYRDEAAAARARLAQLELELAERHLSRKALARYRDALRDEWHRLAHAVVWYQNGERFGFNRLRERDDLSPAQAAPLGLPAPGQLAEAMGDLDARAAMARAQAVERALAQADPSLDSLRGEVERLRAGCAQLRAMVNAYQLRHPDHPPPPEYRAGKALAILGASCGGVLALLMLLAAFL